MRFLRRRDELENEALKACFHFLESLDVDNLKPGRYEVNSTRDIYGEYMEKFTICQKERIWEAHKKYVDFHVVLSGCERISAAGQATEGIYHGEKDYQEITSAEDVQDFLLSNEEALVLFPGEAHRTMCDSVDGQHEMVKKFVFKIPSEGLNQI